MLDVICYLEMGSLRTWVFYHSAYDSTCVKLPQVIRIDYGMKEDDPIDQMRFYSKKDPTKAFKISKDQVRPMLMLIEPPTTHFYGCTVLNELGHECGTTERHVQTNCNLYQVFFLKPKSFSQHQIRIYYKKETDEETIKAINDDWSRNFPKPQVSESVNESNKRTLFHTAHISYCTYFNT